MASSETVPVRAHPALTDAYAEQEKENFVRRRISWRLLLGRGGGEERKGKRGEQCKCSTTNRVTLKRASAEERCTKDAQCECK